MPPVVPSCPFLRVRLSANSPDDLSVELLKIPGVRLQRGLWLVPHHAVPALSRTVLRYQSVIEHAVWARPRPADPSWEEVEAYLNQEKEAKVGFVGSFALDYQKEALCVGARRSGIHFWHATGAGKTYTAIMWALLAPGNVLVVTKAAARFQYAREWQTFTHCDPYIIRPASAMRKRMETLEQYTARMKGRRMVVVTAWESLSHSVSRLMPINFTSIIWDEIHMGKSSKRWDSVPLPELPEDSMEAARVAADQEDVARSRGGFISTKDGERAMMVPLENTAMAAARLSKTAQRRCATTATPVKDRVRDLWAQLDLVEPDAWGPSGVWLDRYADRKPGVYGGFDTTGSSNVEELSERLAFVRHHVAYAVTHRTLPPKRRQMLYVSVEDQTPPSAGFAKAMKAAAARGSAAILEVKLQETASRKRKAVLGFVEDQIYSNNKVVIFTGRRQDVEDLAALVGKTEAAKNKKPRIWAAHGDHSSEARAEMVLEYMAEPGPCVFVGTGDSFGTSLNMHDTDAAFFVMLPYTPGALRQWEGRFCRHGQKRPVTINYLIAEDTHDERLADILIAKLPAVQQVAEDHELMESRDVIAGATMKADLDAFADKILAKVAVASESTYMEDDGLGMGDWDDD